MNLKHHVKWFEEIRGQFEYGGKKYAQTETKEATDCLFDDFGKNWLFGTLAKYVKRYSNLARERDLLKIACYCFILWLKRGFHLKEEGTIEIINTTVDVKSKYFGTFGQRVFHFMTDFFVNLDFHETPLDRIYFLLKLFGTRSFKKITEQELFEIFALCYYLWEKDIPDEKKGKDEDIYNETGGKKKEENNG